MNVFQTPQFRYALKKAGIALAIAAIPIIIAFVTDNFGADPNNQVFVGLGVAILSSLLATLKRAQEGLSDGDRALSGRVIPADVPQTISRLRNEGFYASTKEEGFNVRHRGY